MREQARGRLFRFREGVHYHLPMTSGAETPRTRLRSFHELMQQRVRRILLVASLYDSFILAEEGNIQETLLSHFLELDIGNTPDLIQVSSTAEAVRFLEEDPNFDLVVARIHMGDADAVELAKELKERGIEIPVIGLAYTARELAEHSDAESAELLERTFLWQGDVRLLLAMVKYAEDRWNVERDSGHAGVPVILLVEDSVRFYSSFLPTIYSELLHHTQRLLSEHLSPSQRRMRMRARPKVLLCTEYEEAWAYFERYEDKVMAVLSDVEFPLGGRSHPRAGIELCSQVRERRSDVRLVLQSTRGDHRREAEALGASFLQKGSQFLLHDLRRILVERCGFGDFIFRLPDGTQVDRAPDLKTLAKKLALVPAESVAYHAGLNHFSMWMKARAEFALAERLRPRRVEEFESVEGLRQFLLDSINECRLEQQRTVIVDFNRDDFEPNVGISRIGGGSIGGKARGIAFANRILHEARFNERYPNIDIYAPPAVVVATDVFDEFLEFEDLRSFAVESEDDEAITRRFIDAPFPREAVSDLYAYLQRVRCPLAVRSSGLLEDSLSQPFAGVYTTYMLPNNHPDLDVRWRQLSSTIKRVYASVFSQRAKTYLEMSSYRLEEERMAVMIQELVGRQHEDRFYPDFAGVARSWNFYPEPGQSPEDGVVAVALGLGQAVVGGDPCLRFSPRHPKRIVSLSSVRDALESSQREFFALDLRRRGRSTEWGDVRRFPLEVAEQDGVLAWIGSTYVPEDDRIVDGIARPGRRLVSFAQVLKHGAFPLAEVVDGLLHHCRSGTGVPVELEFAGNLASAERGPAEFAFLQLRPLSLSSEREEVEIGDVPDAAVLVRSPRVLGHGRIEDLRDIVAVDIKRFERLRSREVAGQIARFDAKLRRERRPYLLIGVGRWGSSDPSLGIPVGWTQIAGTRVIVEAGLRDLRVAPSQGTHFFQNLTSSNVGYFTVNPDAGEGFVDWAWLRSLPAVEETEFVRHIRRDRPLLVKMNGRTGEGVILKSDPSV